ncbi:MAG: GNAT family N-acetyltransferase [Epsilonproteobacteria bacterium]|nr:GNAT family N-acetyltransferase [Campylobacterota bacterium]
MSAILDWLYDLEAIDVSIEREEDVKRLDLSSCDIESLPDDFGKLTSLYSLNLADNKLTTLPDSLEALKNLGFIDLRNNAFQKVPSVLYTMALKSLNLSFNQLKRVENFPYMIRVLNLSNNEIGDIGSEIGGLLELRSLNLSQNHIHSIDSGIVHLVNLEILNLEGNYLKSVPNIASIPNLTQLNLSENMLDQLPDFSQSVLERLDISTNQFTYLRFSGMEDLEELILDDNPLEDLQLEVEFAPYLNTFFADGCALEVFPELEAKKYITTLSLSGNQICDLPDTLALFEQLEILDVDDNEIIFLPKIFDKLTHLKKLYVKGNPLAESEIRYILSFDLEYCDLVDLSHVEIAEATPQDIKAMNKLLEQLFALERDFEYDESKHTKAFELLVSSASATIIVAKYQGLVVGLSTMQELISTASGGVSGVIEDVVVQKSYRRLGVGSRIIDYMTKIAMDKEYKRLQLVADKKNTKALHFYMKKGWKTTNLQAMHYLF